MRGLLSPIFNPSSPYVPVETIMAPSTPKGSDPSPDLLVELVEILDAHGLAGDSYQLHDAVDVDALEQLLASSTGDVEIRLTVEGSNSSSPTTALTSFLTSRTGHRTNSTIGVSHNDPP